MVKEIESIKNNSNLSRARRDIKPEYSLFLNQIKSFILKYNHYIFLFISKKSVHSLKKKFENSPFNRKYYTFLVLSSAEINSQSQNYNRCSELACNESVITVEQGINKKIVFPTVTIVLGGVYSNFLSFNFHLNDTIGNQNKELLANIKAE